MKTTLITTVFNRSHLLRWHLTQLSAQTYCPDEILVINDGMPDDTESICRQFSQLPIRYLFTGQRNLSNGIAWRCPGFCLNIAVKFAVGELLIISCAEIYPLENDVLSQMTQELLRQSKAIVITDGKNDIHGSFLDYLNKNQTHNDAMYCSLPELCTFYPFFLAIRKSEYYAIGGYDEDFTGVGYDDTDFVRRLQNNGCFYVKTNCRIVHLYHPPSNEGISESNRNLYLTKTSIVRNEGREWGVFKQEHI